MSLQHSMSMWISEYHDYDSNKLTAKLQVPSSKDVARGKIWNSSKMRKNEKNPQFCNFCHFCDAVTHPISNILPWKFRYRQFYTISSWKRKLMCLSISWKILYCAKITILQLVEISRIFRIWRNGPMDGFLQLRYQSNVVCRSFALKNKWYFP